MLLFINLTAAAVVLANKEQSPLPVGEFSIKSGLRRTWTKKKKKLMLKRIYNFSFYRLVYVIKVVWQLCSTWWTRTDRIPVPCIKALLFSLPVSPQGQQGGRAPRAGIRHLGI